MSEALGTIGKYQLRRQLGRGAMGVVYEAFDTVIERAVAVKVLRTNVFAADQLADMGARFKREAHSAASSRTPTWSSHLRLRRARRRAVHRHGPDERPGALRQARGERACRCDGEEVELLAALSYAHERSIVHRDIKP